VGGQRDHDVLHPGQLFQEVFTGQAHRLHPFGGFGRFGFEDEGHAVALHVERTHQVAGHHVAAIGQGQAGQGLKDALAGLAHVLSFRARRDRSAPR
jgi:hypothetical protein